MTVLTGLGVFWYAILGLVAFIAAVMLVALKFGEESCGPNDGKFHMEIYENQEQKHRDKWLLQHFGVEGRRRWLANEAICLAWHEQRFPKVTPLRRAADGGSEGWVNQWMRSCNKPRYCAMTEGWLANPPWGPDRETYNEGHGWGSGKDRNERKRGSIVIDGKTHYCHGEPYGTDWLAAGFWDPIVVDGHRIDPIEELKKDIYWSYANLPGLPNFEDMESWHRWVKEAWTKWRREYGKAPGEILMYPSSIPPDRVRYD
jgi:hypothetical protein